MQNRSLAVIVLSSMVQLACSGGSSSDGSSDTLPTNAPDSRTPASHLDNAPASNHGPGEANAVPGGSGASAASPAGSSPDVPVPVPVPVPDPNSGAGPKPTASCPVSKDAQGFFTRTSSKSSYVAYVPASYDGTAPHALIVGLHGCGDTAMNFATWGVNPYDTRATQQHIGISIGGQDGNCWSAADDDKVLAAVDDIAQCFWVHQKKVTIAGFSSGGELAYRVGLAQASRFAGILIEDSGLYAANGNPDGLLVSAAWKLNIAHRAHTSDTVFPLAKVKADWAKTTAAGFPLLTSETAGGHDGVSADWAGWLIPLSAAFTAP